MKLNNVGTQSLGSFLKDHIYYLPDYQRHYAWGITQWEDLRIDLLTL